LHDLTETVDILGWLLDLQSDLFDIVVQAFKHSVGSDVKILRVSVLPRSDLALETCLNVFSLEAQGANLVKAWYGQYLVLEVVELVEFLLEIFKLWIGAVELFELLLLVSLPKPVESAETCQESSNAVLGSLDRTSKEKNDLNDLLILGNPIVEWLSEFFWLILLVPVLDVFGRLKDMACSSVDSALNLFKSWLKCA